MNHLISQLIYKIAIYFMKSINANKLYEFMEIHKNE